ncbi:MAG TPA: alanine racemase [Ilumatobacteraceae bacterium]|nr:alanine racemase [Ilumatobacteraceae bacterium]
MALRLTVQRAAWESHIDSVAAHIDGLVPVVKGNGYGFGRPTLHPLIKSLADFVCVGTIYELDGVADRVTPIVLTPSLVPPPTPSSGLTPVMTVGTTGDVDALAGWHGRAIIKLQSSMRRYGASPAELEYLTVAVRTAGLDIVGYSLHLPLAGTDHERLVEVEGWLDHLDPKQPLWLSHLQQPTYSTLRSRHPDRMFHLRMGTGLWHGDKSFLQLDADVLGVHRVLQGDRAGYQLNEVIADGHLVLVSAGSAHGVAPLAGGLSPFHFARHRLLMLEPPHMHTSMVFVPLGDPCPAVGDRVDVQRPLITTIVDEVEWV